MESIPFLIAPFFSGAITIAAPPPSMVRYHRFVYAAAVSCTTLIIATVFRIEENLSAVSLNVPLSVVVGTQLLTSIFIIACLHIYLSTEENKAKCSRLLAEQDKVKIQLLEDPTVAHDELLSRLREAQKALSFANMIISLLVLTIYALLVTAVFPSLLLIINSILF
ncbi:MAG: hypothetical protein HWD84_11135 [Flavobacteriaceae bacterium]|nr:hypothetical protein [Flavobacteriaceae bacterium]